MPPRKNGPDKSVSLFTAKLNEAETLQQRAERRHDAASYEAAATAFQQALRLAPASDTTQQQQEQIDDCRFGLAESLQRWAETLCENTATAPDRDISISIEREVAARACFIFEHAVINYQQVRDGTDAPAGPSGMRVDAAVDCANSLAGWADAALEAAALEREDAEAASRSRQLALSLLSQAEDCYRAAAAKEEDAATWSNMGDVMTTHGEVLCDEGNVAAGFAKFGAARDAFAHACGLSSSENGDDLPGLLLNWGAGLYTMAGKALTGDVAMPLLEEAAVRLRHSISFDRGDPAPHVALGEVLVGTAEWMNKAGDAEGAKAALKVAGGEEGYHGALRIKSDLPEALVGMAETYAHEAKLAAAAGDSMRAAIGWAHAIEQYSRALEQPEALGSTAQRSDVRYNLACCLAGEGGARALGDAAQIVKQLVSQGSITMADAQQDPDLAALRGVLF